MMGRDGMLVASPRYSVHPPLASFRSLAPPSLCERGVKTYREWKRRNVSVLVWMARLLPKMV